MLAGAFIILTFIVRHNSIFDAFIMRLYMTKVKTKFAFFAKCFRFVLAQKNTLCFEGAFVFIF